MMDSFKKIIALLCLCAIMPWSLAEDIPDEKTAWDALLGKTAADISSVYYRPEGNISARAGYAGQCTWYAYGRFYEVTGIELETALHAKYWLARNDQDERLEVVYGDKNIIYPSIAVSTAGAYGHVLFVEYVSMNEGRPENVYFTECNWDGNGQYDKGRDAAVLRLPFDLFIRFRTPAGYISAKDR